MKTIKEFFRVIIAATVMASSMAGVLAQTPDAAGNKTRQRLVTKNPERAKTTAQDAKSKPNAKHDGVNQDSDSMGPEESSNTSQTASVVKSSALPAVPEESQANRHEQASEEAAIVPYYNNFSTPTDWVRKTSSRLASSVRIATLDRGSLCRPADASHSRLFPEEFL